MTRRSANIAILQAMVLVVHTVQAKSINMVVVQISVVGVALLLLEVVAPIVHPSIMKNRRKKWHTK